MDTFADDLRGIIEVDDDLGRTPAELGIAPEPALSSAVGDTPKPAPAMTPGVGNTPAPTSPTVVLASLLLALPIPRTLLLAAAHTGLITVALPAPVPEELHDLLFERSGLTLDQATNVVDLTVDLLAQHLGTEATDVQAPNAPALDDADRTLGAAAASNPAALATAASLVLATIDELTGLPDLAERLAAQGLARTAARLLASAG